MNACEYTVTEFSGSTAWIHRQGVGMLKIVLANGARTQGTDKRGYSDALPLAEMFGSEALT